MAASGSKITRMGAEMIKGYTDERTPVEMTWQIAGVKGPLAPIGKICDAGNSHLH